MGGSVIAEGTGYVTNGIKTYVLVSVELEGSKRAERDLIFHSGSSGSAVLNFPLAFTTGEKSRRGKKH